MLELFSEAIRPVNLPFTILLGIVTGYWLLVVAGFLDFDVHGGEVDVSPDGATDLAHATEGVSGSLKSAMQFLNFGDVPGTIVGSILVLALWTFSMIGNHYFGDGSTFRTIIILGGNAVLAVLVTKACTSPLKKFFKALNKEYEEHIPVVGRTCTITTSEVTEKFGQAQIDTSGAPLLINVRTFGDTILTKGEAALIIKEDKENNLFTVAKLTTTTPQQETSLC